LLNERLIKQLLGFWWYSGFVRALLQIVFHFICHFCLLLHPPWNPHRQRFEIIHSMIERNIYFFGIIGDSDLPDGTPAITNALVSSGFLNQLNETENFKSTLKPEDDTNEIELVKDFLNWAVTQRKIEDEEFEAETQTTTL